MPPRTASSPRTDEERRLARRSPRASCRRGRPARAPSSSVASSPTKASICSSTRLDGVEVLVRGRERPLPPRAAPRASAALGPRFGNDLRSALRRRRSAGRKLLATRRLTDRHRRSARGRPAGDRRRGRRDLLRPRLTVHVCPRCPVAEAKDHGSDRAPRSLSAAANGCRVGDGRSAALEIRCTLHEV